MSTHTTHFSVDDEPLTTTEHELTPNQILSLAGVDATTHYLVRLEGKSQQSYQDKGASPIPVHENERFISVSTGPTPLS